MFKQGHFFCLAPALCCLMYSPFVLATEALTELMSKLHTYLGLIAYLFLPFCFWGSQLIPSDVYVILF
ncbi:hypothetical protein XELAEV_18035931mg [Xenopus laevis]|uniref:Uncharacterized protein n=1 Tax=Xenopus laevis TaxID=8355 RepID=A0A974HCJ8_XENLA|nr:hypothetical protein XELAEV_18035931mg [Xenopus laevis]